MFGLKNFNNVHDHVTFKNVVCGKKNIKNSFQALIAVIIQLVTLNINHQPNFSLASTHHHWSSFCLITHLYDFIVMYENGDLRCDLKLG